MGDSTSSKSICPVCSSTNTERYLHTNLTTFFFPLPETLIEKATKEPFKLNICQQCSFIYQVEVKGELLGLIYNEFYKHYNLDTSVEFQEVYRKRTIEFMGNILSSTENATALDLGCGEGTYFPFFESMGYQCYGIEPSEKAVIAKEKNPNATILHKYFEGLESNEFNVNFDVILMNWVLEHIADMDSFFIKLEKYLKVGTKLVIQVPDIKYYMDNNLPLFYVHEHINYFTNETLSLLLERKGFKMVGSKFGTSPAIIVCAEYTGSPIESLPSENNYQALFESQKTFLQANKDLKKEISKVIAQFNKVVFYGMGLLAFWIGDECLERKDFDKIDLVDDNSFYKDKFVALFNKQLTIFAPDHNFDDTLVLICTSPVYHEKILKAIHEHYEGNYTIGLIKNNELVLTPKNN